MHRMQQRSLQDGWNDMGLSELLLLVPWISSSWDALAGNSSVLNIMIFLPIAFFPWISSSWDALAGNSSVLNIMIFLPIAFFLTTLAWGYYRWLLDPTNVVNSLRAPANQTQIYAPPPGMPPPPQFKPAIPSGLVPSSTPPFACFNGSPATRTPRPRPPAQKTACHSSAWTTPSAARPHASSPSSIRRPLARHLRDPRRLPVRVCQRPLHRAAGNDRVALLDTPRCTTTPGGVPRRQPHAYPPVPATNSAHPAALPPPPSHSLPLLQPAPPHLGPPFIPPSPRRYLRRLTRSTPSTLRMPHRILLATAWVEQQAGVARSGIKVVRCLRPAGGLRKIGPAKLRVPTSLSARRRLVVEASFPHSRPRTQLTASLPYAPRDTRGRSGSISDFSTLIGLFDLPGLQNLSYRLNSLD
ncbi:hypothetical protein B0H11DRAFT_2259682 [Mycena galericulata]|nr:hypothetical protein B0H11DRAFT_2259682 [Mycena galericulata]